MKKWGEYFSRDGLLGLRAMAQPTSELEKYKTAELEATARAIRPFIKFASEAIEYLQNLNLNLIQPIVSAMDKLNVKDSDFQRILAELRVYLTMPGDLRERIRQAQQITWPMLSRPPYTDRIDENARRDEIAHHERRLTKFGNFSEPEAKRLMGLLNQRFEDLGHRIGPQPEFLTTQVLEKGERGPAIDAEFSVFSND